MIQVLQRAFDIIDLLSGQIEQGRGLKLSEIAAKIGIFPSTCANILKELVSYGYAENLGRAEGYVAGFRLRQNGGKSFQGRLVQVARSEMKDLSRQLNEGSILAALKEDNRIILHQEKAVDQEMQVITRTLKEAYYTATGRVILSHMEDDQISSYAEQYGLPESQRWPEVLSLSDLKNELGKIREAGISVQFSQSMIAGISVPILHNARAIAGLAIVLPAQRLDDSRRELIISLLKGAADRISLTLS